MVGFIYNTSFDSILEDSWDDLDKETQEEIENDYECDGKKSCVREASKQIDEYELILTIAGICLVIYQVFQVI